MKPTLRQALLGVAFLIVYGAVVFAGTRAYYLEQATARPPAASAPAGGAARPIAIPQARPPVTLADDPAVLADQADELLTQKRFGEAIEAYRALHPRAGVVAWSRYGADDERVFQAAKARALAARTTEQEG